MIELVASEQIVAAFVKSRDFQGIASAEVGIVDPRGSRRRRFEIVRGGGMDSKVQKAGRIAVSVGLA